MGNIFRIAVLQKCSAAKQYRKNTELVLDAMTEAKQNNADILLLPEAFITGYSMPVTKEEAIDEHSIYIREICGKARELHIGVVATAFSKGKEKARNTAYLIDKYGKIIMKYDKVHTCDFADEKCLESGQCFKVCDFGGIKFGIMICYDREYPESARILMLEGAEIILVPNDCDCMKPRLNALSVRAYENMVCVVMANPPGDNCGNSCAYSPVCWDGNGRCIDNTILLTDETFEGLAFADFDMDSIRQYRSSEMMGNTFRKVKAYAKLLDESVLEPFKR